VATSAANPTAEAAGTVLVTGKRRPNYNSDGLQEMLQAVSFSEIVLTISSTGFCLCGFLVCANTKTKSTDT